MDIDFYRCSINKYDYCIFLECNTLACYIEQLMHMSFKKNKLIVDQLFYSGNKENRFIVFDIINGAIDCATAKNLKISNQMKRRINSVILTKYNDVCLACLSSYDYKNLTNEKSL